MTYKQHISRRACMLGRLMGDKLVSSSVSNNLCASSKKSWPLEKALSGFDSTSRLLECVYSS